MPLLDHFHSPLFPTHSWKSFHSRWANSIGDALNRLLPRRYFTEIQTNLGTQVEADVAEFESPPEPENEPGNGSAGGVAVQPWAPPVATMVMPAVFPDDLEVQVIDTRDGSARLVAVVELVSPSNKDPPESRSAFAAKCAAYLQRGIGLITVDIVTSRRFNLHDELVGLMNLSKSFTMTEGSSLYAVAYRPARRQGNNEIDVWPTNLSVGGPLPVLPLGLLNARPVPVDLETTYTDACQRSRL